MKIFLEWQFMIVIHFIFLLIFKGQSVKKQMCLTLPDVPLLLSSCSSFIYFLFFCSCLSFSHFLVVAWRVMTSRLFDNLIEGFCKNRRVSSGQQREYNYQIIAPLPSTAMVLWFRSEIGLYSITSRLKITRTRSFNFELCEFHTRLMQNK